MIRDFYAPSDFDTRDFDPSLSAEEKLRIIASAPVIATPANINGKNYYDDVRVSLPFITGGHFATGLGRSPVGNTVLCDYFALGDEQLYGHGVGSRLLRSALRWAVASDSRTEVLQTNWARLGMVNTAVKVLGEENVGVRAHGADYGWGADKPLEEIFDDYPPIEGKAYLVHYICARIDRDLAMSWEAPVPADKDTQVS